MIEISIVIPVFNEEENLPELLDRCLVTCRKIGRSFEIILVDDGSRDRSREILARNADQHPEVVAVILNRNYGQHAAVFAGLAQSRGETIVTLDADLQNLPEDIPRLLEQIENGADVVGTMRADRHDTFFRRTVSKVNNYIIQKATGVKMHDYGCMLRAYRRPVVDAMLQCKEHSTFIPVLANTFASHVVEIPVDHAPRRNGPSRYDIMKLIMLEFDLLTSMSTLPLRMLTFLGIVSFLCGAGLGGLLIVLRLMYGAGWAGDGVFTLFAILFIFVGAQFFGLGLLGEYIGRIYHDVRSRPRYFVQEVRGQQDDSVATTGSC